MRKRVPTLFEYGHYYENGKHDNHESLPEVRTMSSPAEILASGLAQTAIKRFLHDNAVPEPRLSRPLACHRVPFLSVIVGPRFQIYCSNSETSNATLDENRCPDWKDSRNLHFHHSPR